MAELLVPQMDAILAAARGQAGSSDLGEQFAGADLFEGLRHHLQAVDALPYTSQGLLGVRAALDRFLVNRLRFHADLDRTPEILEEDVSDPIVVIGLPRTGTTKLSRMMSAHSGVQPCTFWRFYNPSPFPDTVAGAPDPRIEDARSVISAMQTGSPEFFAMHYYEAEEPDEDGHLHQLTFSHPIMWLGNPTPEYLAYLRSLPRAPSYRYVKALLQYLQWQDGGKRGRPWLLKNPTSLGCLDEIIAAHENATIVICERDFADVIPSFCRLLELIYRQSFETVDLHQLGSNLLEFWAYEYKRSLAMRERHRARIVEVPYQRIVGDCISVIDEVFETAGMPLTSADRAAMLDWEAANPQGKHGKADYSLERFGLTREQVGRAFS